MEKVEKPPEEVTPNQRHEGENDSYGQIAGQGNHHSEEWEYENLRPDSYTVTQHHVGEGFDEGAEARLHDQLGSTLLTRSWITSWYSSWVTLTFTTLPCSSRHDQGTPATFVPVASR